MLEVEIFCGMEGLERLKVAWCLLLARHSKPRFFHFFEWWRAYLIALDPSPDSMYFVLFHDHDGPIAIVPLKHRTSRFLGFPVRELGFPNHPHMPLQDALYRPGVDVSTMLAQWFTHSDKEADLRWDVARCYGVMAESPLASCNLGKFEKREGQASAYFDCTRPYEEIYRGFSKNLQGNLRKARNRWAKESEGCFLTVTEPEELTARFHDLLKVEASGWKGVAGSGTAIGLHSDLKKFYEGLISELSPKGAVRLHCMELRGEVIAANFCLSDHDTLYLLKIAYDEKWSEFSPGSLLCEYVLKEAAANPLVKCVSFVTDMEWHKTWRPDHYEVYNLILFNSTPVGQLCRVGIKMKQHFASLRKNNPIEKPPQNS
jgi:hypothetical protein